jgi:hypothetical protein
MSSQTRGNLVLLEYFNKISLPISIYRKVSILNLLLISFLQRMKIEMK